MKTIAAASILERSLLDCPGLRHSTYLRLNDHLPRSTIIIAYTTFASMQPFNF